MLNELDKEMESRGLNFVRYADDCIIMLGSEQAANRVMKNISRFISEKLGLKVNMTKSIVSKPKGIKFGLKVEISKKSLCRDSLKFVLNNTGLDLAIST